MNKKGLKLVRPNSLRKQAEKALAEKPGKARATKVENLERLVHELQVHQIELEMQNDELRRAQEEIAESQSRYADLYDFAPVGYFTLDQKGLIKEVNLTGAQFLGVARRLLIGKSFSLFVEPEARAVFDQHRMMLIKTGQRQASELLLKRKGGTLFVARLESVPATTDKGDAVWRSVITDITEQKRAESQSWLTAIVESSGDAIIGQTPDGTILSWNRGAGRLYGYASDEAIGCPISMLVPPARPDEVPEILRRIRNGEAVNHFETVRVRKDGTHVNVSLTISPVRGAEGTIIGASSIARDITDRKKVEEALAKAHDELEVKVEERTADLTKALAALTAEARELDRAKAALEESETRYRQIVETADEGIWVVDAGNNTSFVNRKMAEMLGYTVEEMMVQPTFAFMDEEGQAIAEAKIERRRRGVKEQFDFTFRRKDGRSVWTIVSANPILDEHGKYTGALRMITDITNRLELERQLRHSHKMEAIGTLAGGIAHDFNNILAAIIGFTEMALDDAPEGSLVRRSMERVFEAGLRGRDLVKRILAFSRKSEQERRQVALISLVQETVRFLRASLPATIDIQFDSRSETDLVFADPTQMEQVLMNLMTNAAHAMREKGGILEIDMSDALFSSPSEVPDPAMQPGPYVKLSVRDTGCGMDKPVLERIFDPFFTTKKTGEGTGLGLSVVHGIVKSHQGAITVSSTPGEGSTFSVYLPKTHASTAQEKAETAPIEGGHERILFVDDEKDVAETGEVTLRGLGLSGDGDEGWR